MPSFKFRGFTTGSLVALTIGQGAASVSAQTTWGQQSGGGGQPNATFSISLIDGCTDVVAPYGAVFRATGFTGFKTPEGADLVEPPGDTNVYDETQHHIYFFWNFDDADYVRLIAPNIPTAWRNLNLGYGKQVAHVWQNGGSYTVECFAVDTLGNWGVATYTFGAGGQSPAIADPDSFADFAGANTILWSQDNDFTGDPTGGTATRCTTIEQVHNALRTQIGTNRAHRNIRILMRAGETFTNNWYFSVGDGNGASPAGSGYPIGLGTSAGVVFDYRGLKGGHFGRFGAGANPKIVHTVVRTKGEKFNTGTGTDHRQWVWSNLDFDGDYNSETETGINGPGASVSAGVCLINRCKSAGDNSIPNGGRFSFRYDSLISEWDNYGDYNQNQHRQAHVGCEYAQSALTLNGLVVPAGNSTDWDMPGRHGAFRSEQVYDLIIDGCYFRSVAGWSTSGAGSNTRPGSASQQAMRHMNYFTSDPNLRRHHHSVTRSAFEGGCAIGPIQWNGTRVETACKNLVFDTNLVVGTSAFIGGVDGYLLSTCLSGVTIRNCYFWRPGVTPVFPYQYPMEINVLFLSNGTLSGIGPVEIYNNTFFIETASSFMTSDYNPIRLASGAPANYYRVSNNVTRVVNRSSPIDYRGTQFLPLGTEAIAGFVPRYPGPRWRFNYIYVSNVTTVREDPLNPGTLAPGPVASGEWVRIPWPNIAGQNNGAAPANATAYRAAVVGNSTQKHFVSIQTYPGVTSLTRLTDTTIFSGSKGGVEFDLSGSTHFRVKNVSGFTWTSTPTNRGIVVLFDMSDILMDPIAVHASPSSLPALRPLAGSGAIIANRPPLWPWGDFFGQPRFGSVLQGGAAVTTGANAAGAFA